MLSWPIWSRLSAKKSIKKPILFSLATDTFYVSIYASSCVIYYAVNRNNLIMNSKCSLASNHISISHGISTLFLKLTSAIESSNLFKIERHEKDFPLSYSCITFEKPPHHHQKFTLFVLCSRCLVIYIPNSLISDYYSSKFVFCMNSHNVIMKNDLPIGKCQCQKYIFNKLVPSLNICR